MNHSFRKFIPSVSKFVRITKAEARVYAAAYRGIRGGHVKKRARPPFVDQPPFMSQMGQTEKNSVRANVFRVAPDSGRYSMQSACLKGANARNRFAIDSRKVSLIISESGKQDIDRR